jgi:hypothetical protein
MFYEEGIHQTKLVLIFPGHLLIPFIKFKVFIYNIGEINGGIIQNSHL